MQIIETTRALRKPNSDGLFDYLVIRQGLMSDYHNHKENMANAGILVQISLFGAVVTESIWPPNWVAHNFSTPEAWTFLAYFMLWGLVHIHIRWQLKNKRAAANWVKGLDNAIRKLLFEKPDARALALDIKSPPRTPRWLRDLIIGLFPVSHYFHMDAGTAGLPKFVANEVESAFKSGSGGDTLEALINITSYALLGIIACKIFLGPGI